MAKRVKKEEIEEIEEVENKEVNEKDKVIDLIKELIPYVIILIVVILLRTFVITPIKVHGESMVPTLDGGELMLLTIYNKNDLERNDIIIANVERADGTKEDVIKRIIALPGEKISIEKGIIFINGKKFDDKYGDGYSNDIDTIELGKDEYFVLGDNRDASYDSSEFGPIKKSQIKGHANLVLFPFDEFGTIK